MSEVNQELFELCKEVYEKTKWGQTKEAWAYPPGLSGRALPYVIENKVYAGLKENAPIHVCPLYTSDYLLEKLKPTMVMFDLFLATNPGVGWWIESFDNEVNITRIDADTPLKALLKLVKALADAGELK